MTTLPNPITLDVEELTNWTWVGIDGIGCTSTTKSLLPVISFVAPLSSNHDTPPEANSCKRSMLGFSYPSKLGGVDTSILHHVFMLIFIASLAVISLHGTILMPFLSYFARFT
ncbi:retrotransposon ty1-copia subclass [Hordeum vulgare]|nr:retrotransposon ty1-copia subclass [Hordeum vulgare]